MRLSTFLMLMEFETGPVRLSDAVRTSLKSVPLEFILTEPHLASLDRRLRITLRQVFTCLDKATNVKDVLQDDLH